MNASFRYLLVVGLVAVTILAAPPAARAVGTLCYVDIDAFGGGNTGTSWVDAYISLQSALADVNCDEIWVAEGVYKPHASDAAISFSIGSGLDVYGGFAATETLREQRDPARNVTILTGDMSGNDLNGDGNLIAETSAAIVFPNSYHVVKFDGTLVDVTASTVLDGFVITAGRADALFNDKGGGLRCDGSGAGNVCSPTLAQLTVSGNWAWYGGGLYSNGTSGGNSSPTLTDVTFTGNNNGGTGSGTAGGGLYNDGAGGNSSPTLHRVAFYANGNAGTTNAGGGMYDDGSGGLSSPIIETATFVDNAGLFGGGVSHVGGDFSSLTLNNVTFHGNTSSNSGGAIYQSGDGILENSILWGDTAVNLGNEIYGDGNLYIRTSVVQGSGGSGGSWDPGLGTDGGGNLDADPMLGPLLDNGGFTQSMAIPAGSPAIDAGDDLACDARDQRGVSRPRGPHCDIGAFEHIPPVTDFDGDDKTDPAKFITSTGAVWWFRSSDATWDGMGMGADVASYVSRSDFDGDGMTDAAKYVSVSQSIWYFESSSSSWQGQYMGAGSYSLLPGSDFDGDQMTDPAKYDTLGSVWRLPSSTGVWEGTFIGTDAAPALPGSDYDGDGKTDVAKYVAAGAIWYQKSSDSTWDGAYIGSDGTPVPASDFDGDGITDMAKYLTGSNTLWYLASGTSSWQGAYLGPGTFTYVAASDFDGDGKTDPAKFDTGSKVLWYLKSSTGLWDAVYMGPEAYTIAD